jgi:lipopolysaccharide export system protein LptC
VSAEDDFDLIPGLDRHAPTTPRPRAPWWDRLSIYLPIMLMGLLALASYWLLRATPEAPDAQPDQAVTGDPDYYMRNFSVKSFDPSGKIRSEVVGAEARHYPDNDRVEIDEARIRNLAETGAVMTAVAQRVTTNADNTIFVLEGDAVVVREGGRNAKGDVLPRLEFRGDFLRVELEPVERVSSHLPVEVLRNTDRITALTLDYRGDERVADFQGRVRVQLNPRTGP